MSPLLIYTPQNGEYLKTVLDAVVTLLGEETFKTGIDIIMILAISVVGYQYVMGKKLGSLVHFVVLSFFVSYCLLGIRVPVAIIDMQYEANGAGTALTVDHVPLGIALPAALISGMGYGVTSAFSDVFHMPQDLDYIKTGMIFGSRTWLAATNTRLSMSPDLASDMSAYIRQCIFSAKLLASHQITPQNLVHSEDLAKTYFENPSPVYRIIMHDGRNLSCGDGAADLKKRLPTAAKLELEHLGRLMTPDDTTRTAEDKFSRIYEAAHDYYMRISNNAASVLTQNILINATRDAATDAFAFVGADAELMNYTNTDSMQNACSGSQQFLACEFSFALLHDGDVDLNLMYFPFSSHRCFVSKYAECLWRLFKITSLSVVMAADVYHHSFSGLTGFKYDHYSFWTKNGRSYFFKH